MKIAVGLALLGVAVGFSLSSKQEREEKMKMGCVDIFSPIACNSMKRSGQCESIPDVRNNYCCDTCVPKKRGLPVEQTIQAKCSDQFSQVACDTMKRSGQCESIEQVRTEYCCQTCSDGTGGKRTSAESKHDDRLAAMIARYLSMEDGKK